MVYPDSIERAAIFLKLLAMIRGTVASIGYPDERESPARFLIPFWNLPTSDEGSILITSSGKIAPSSYTPMILIPYANGFILSFLRRAASEALTFLSLVQTLKSLVI